MSQMIYAIAALAAVTLFSVSVRSSGVSAEQQMYITETRSRMLGVAQEAIERITRMEVAFDEKTNPDTLSQYEVFPYVDSPAELTPAASFGSVLCNDLENVAGCFDLDDFHGISLSDLDAEGMPYGMEIEVAYVDTLTGAASGSQTYAKEVTVTVSSGVVKFGGEDISVSYARVFGYPSAFDYARGAESLLNGELYQ
jgi:hypothetical protein